MLLALLKLTVRSLEGVLGRGGKARGHYHMVR
jgi:hypothetical protein